MAIVTCPKCGAKNRVDERGQTMQPVCGRCKTKLNAGNGAPEGARAGNGKPRVVTDATFVREVVDAAPVPVLLDCWAPWCGPCRMLTPTIEQLAAEARGRWVVGKLNVDDNRKVASRFHIDSIPTMLIFKGGKLVDRIVGLQSKAAIEKRLLAKA
jgi:thioredoxin 2